MRMRQYWSKCYWLASLWTVVSSLSATPRHSRSSAVSRRHWFHQSAVSLSFVSGASWMNPSSVFAATGDRRSNMEMRDSSPSEVAYKTVSLNIPDFGVQVPVACWFPADGSTSEAPLRSRPKYQHRISVRRIGELLARWDFIPEFASRNFAFSPTTSSGSVLNGDYFPFPTSPKVVILAHGFLGSRFDLSHIAEDLASKGFICVSPEYPESLAASYGRMPDLDRAIVNNELLKYINISMQPSGYGVVGHSLGCGMALRIGDASWARVLIAGPPAPEDCPSPLLYISSLNDGLVRSRGGLTIPPAYQRLQENDLPTPIPRRAALIFDRPDAPNHISYLSENVNDAMVGFLSPLLPVAQAMSIPVLDFDKYQVSRDSKPTAAIIKPLISDFLVQQLKSS